MRAEYQTLVGRDHLAFRSYYYPVKVRKKKDYLFEKQNDLIQ
jgi:hypothetical protein